MFDKAHAEKHFTYLYSSQPAGLGATKANIMRLLRSVDLIGWSTHEESGKLDRKAFTRYSVGSVSIFSKRTHVEATKSAVSILIDCSGSMQRDNRIQTAEAVSIQLARILEKADASFSVTGFNGADRYNRIEESGALKTTTTIRSERTTFIPFKTWGESLSKASFKMGTIHQWAEDSTPDYSAISLTLEGLASRPEQRKVFFLLTDAEQFEVSHMKYLQSLANKLGIKVVAIGIGNTKIAKCFDNAQNVSSVDGLASASFNRLLKQLR